MSGFCFSKQVGELCAGPGRITLEQLCNSKGETALARGPSVADRVGEVASFFGGRARKDRIARKGRRPIAWKPSS